MAFTKIAAAGIGSTGTVTLQNIIVTGSVSTPSITGAASTENVRTNSLAVSGVTTSSGGFVGNVTGNATGLSGTPNITVGSITAASATFSGNVSIAGTLTYEDVTNIDSIGVVTARSNVLVGGNLNVTGVSTFGGNVYLGDSDNLYLGNSNDLRIVHDGSNSYIKDDGTGSLFIQTNGSSVTIQNTSGNNIAEFVNGSSVNLYHNNSKRLETYSSGIIVSGGRITGADGSNFTMSVGTAHDLEFRTNDTHRLSVTSSGHTAPALDNTYDLGTSSYRWRNIYTADLQMSNEGSQNDIDGTWGKYTIQEGENDLFLINRRTGKKYKFLLEEVK
jgi:hypothetical protein